MLEPARLTRQHLRGVGYPRPLLSDCGQPEDCFGEVVRQFEIHVPSGHSGQVRNSLMILAVRPKAPPSPKECTKDIWSLALSSKAEIKRRLHRSQFSKCCAAFVCAFKVSAANASIGADFIGRPSGWLPTRQPIPTDSTSLASLPRVNHCACLGSLNSRDLTQPLVVAACIAQDPLDSRNQRAEVSWRDPEGRLLADLSVDVRSRGLADAS